MSKKSILWLILSLGLFNLAWAQGSFIQVNGQVNNSSGQPISSEAITVEYSGAQGFFQTQTVYTSVLGEFVDTMFVAPPQNGVITVYADSCPGAGAVDTFYFDTSYFQVFQSNLTINCGQPASCNANFFYSFSAFTGFTFFNQSSPMAGSSYSWDFGDGSTSTATNPSHVYGSPGTYTVCLTISNSILNCTDTICKTVNFNPGSCATAFVATDFGNGFYAFQVDTSTTTSATTFEWDFGDGNTDSSFFAFHQYTTPGVYNACLISSNNFGCADTTCQTITINAGVGCQANFGWFISGNGSGTTYNFFNQSSSLPGSSLTYNWDFGDGNFSGVANPTHTFAAPGSYTVCLVIDDTANSCTDTICKVINYTPSPCPTASFTSSAQPNGVIFLSADTSGSSPYTHYDWNLGNGSSASGPFAVVSYPVSGTYNICLTVQDSLLGCVDTFCQTVTVGAGNCQASFTYDTLGLTANFFAQPVGSGFGVNYVWDMGGLGTAYGQNPSFTFPGTGAYVVCLSTYDSLTQCSDNICQTIFVTDTTGASCQANFALSGVVPGTNIAIFDNLSTPSNPLNYTQVIWYWGDGTSDTYQFAASQYSHAYPGPGTYQVTLGIELDYGCFDSLTQTIVITGSNPNVCQAAFTADTFGLTVQFTNQSLASVGTSYFWDFGDGVGFSTATNPSYTYAASGSYFVTLHLYDSLANCDDTAFQFVDVIQGGYIPFCQADFFTLPLGNQGFIFTGTQSGPNAQYIWDFGDGTVDTLANPVAVHVFAQPNQYNVCLTIIDTTGTGCIDSICLPVDASLGANLCQANFSWNKTATGTYQFLNLSTPQPDSQYVSYFWDFGDSTTSTDVNPTKVFNGVGPWTVCLTVTDIQAGCSDQICFDVADSLQALNVSGLVLTNGIPAFSGIVYLVQHDSTAIGGASLTAVDSTYLNGSFYHFQNVQPGTYLIKAALLPGSFNYSNYMPTYLGDELFWYNATSTIVGAGSVVNPPINLVAGNNPGGPGFIGGFVAQGANKQGDPMANVSILLMNEDMGAVTHVVTDQNGDFSLEDLAYGTYHVYVEMMGRYADPYTLTLSPDNPSYTGIEFEVSDQDVTITSLQDVELAQDLKAFPNPTEGRLNISWNQLEVARAEVKLRNLMGQELRSESLNQAQGLTEVTWNLSDLPRGLYMVEVNLNNQIQTLRVTLE